MRRQVYGREWSYGGAPGRRTGVVCEVPRTNRKHRYRETISLGTTRLSASEVSLLIGDLIEKWLGEDYHWLHRNCLAFANEFCRKLGVGNIPAWIDRLPRGVCALDEGVRNLAETVRGLADGTRAAAHALAEGRLQLRLRLPQPCLRFNSRFQYCSCRVCSEPRTRSSRVVARLRSASSLRRDAHFRASWVPKVLCVDLWTYVPV
ncbi:unnamed protein product [Symbiodinium sp. KB8]|nr:unnamed protein product [Symbiodinium sp. KB8]